MEASENMMENETPTLNTCGLFDDLDILHCLEDTKSLDQICPDEAKYPLGLLDELHIKSSEPASIPLESLLDLGESSSCLENPFFEQFMDLDQLFPELPLLDTLKLGFEVEPTFPVTASDICQSDVVTEETGRAGGEYMEVPSPGSEIIDVVSLESDAEVSSSTGDLSDVALSPASVVDVVSMEEDDGSLPPSIHQLILDCEQAAPAAEEITVVQTSDALTLLTQELTQSSFSYASEFLITPSTEGQLDEDSAEDLSTITVDIDELFSLSDSLGLADSLVLPSVSDVCSENIVTSSTSEISVKAQPKQKRKRSSSSEISNSSAKKVKNDDDDNDSACLSLADVLDKRTVRRLKNNVASKHARASRRQKEQDLFQQEEELEQSNAELRKQLEELQQLTTMLRKALVERLSGGTCPV